MNNTLPDIYRVRTGTQGCAVNGQGQILGESRGLPVRELALAQPRLLAELAAAPGGRLLGAAPPQLLGNAGNVESGTSKPGSRARS